MDIVVDSEVPLPEGLVYQAVADSDGVIIGVQERECYEFFRRVGLPAACRTMTALFARAQRTPGVPVSYGLERRARSGLYVVKGRPGEVAASVGRPAVAPASFPFAASA